jgi:hypothetical protein
MEKPALPGDPPVVAAPSYAEAMSANEWSPSSNYRCQVQAESLTGLVGPCVLRRSQPRYGIGTPSNVHFEVTADDRTTAQHALDFNPLV